MSKRAAEMATLEKLLPSAKIHSNHKLSQSQAVCTATGVRVPNQGHIEQGAKLELLRVSRPDFILQNISVYTSPAVSLGSTGFHTGGGGGGGHAPRPP